MLQNIRSALIPRLSRRDRFLRAIRRNIAALPITQSIFYKLWQFFNEPSKAQIEEQRVMARKMTVMPLISILIVTENASPSQLRETVDSLQEQTYERWELILVSGPEILQPLKSGLPAGYRADSRIKFTSLQNGDLNVGLNHAILQIASGDFVGFLNEGDTLSNSCFFESIKAQELFSESDLIYCDSDIRAHNSKFRVAPFFRPAFNLYYLYAYNYISDFFLMRKSLGDHIGWLRIGFDGAQYYDLILRAVEKARWITHLPFIHYHKLGKPQTLKNALNINPINKVESIALQEHFDRLECAAQVETSVQSNTRQVTYSLKTTPLISIIIPNHDQVECLEKIIDSILYKSAYTNIEIMILENNSTQKSLFEFYNKIKVNPKIRIMEYKETPFNFSNINNFGVKHAKGELILFLNNDIQAINSNWLERLLEYAIQPQIGAVGAKLIFPDESLQHTGVILEGGYRANHRFVCYPSNHAGYYYNLTAPQELSAVTGACLMIRRSVFEEIGGFDPLFRVAFGDVDLCLKARQKGYHIVWTPYAELYHFESQTRGQDDHGERKKRASEEAKYLEQKWKQFLDSGDPFFNPNLTVEFFNYLPAPNKCRQEPRSMRGLAKP